ncbi:MAG TPA: hypothetical protein VN026_10750 [Bacteroidia bacterium]|jgi:hypothetical protein|nr:hypothetical protein [Bacteroidia bacterium]
MENDELLGGEYTNVADLLGESPDFSEMLGRISRLPKDQQGKAIIALTKRPDATIAGNSSRIEFEKKFRQLPKEIREGLLKKRLQLADTRFYVIKDVATKTFIDMILGTDQKNVGLGNLANAKLEKDNWFILSALRLLYAESAGGMFVADFTHISPVIRNGEFEFEAGNKKLVGLISNDVFDTIGRTDVPTGYYKFESVKVIEPQVEIKMPIKFAAAAAANAFLKVVFIGTSVIPF